jgi:hypothetical protein
VWLWTTPPKDSILHPVISNSLYPLKKRLPCKQITTNADVNQVQTFWLQTLDTDLFCLGTKDLMPQWDNGDWGKSGVYHLLPMCHVYMVERIERLESECITSFLKSCVCARVCVCVCVCVRACILL